MMSDKLFDLEQQILNCWNVIDDIDLCIEESDTKELLLAVKVLYELKFQKMWNTFEQVSKEYREVSSERDSFKHMLGSIPTGESAWPVDEERIDNIGQNGNDGLHYTEDAMKSLGEDPGFDWLEHEEQERKDKQKRRSIDELTPEQWDMGFRTIQEKPNG
jgi:hypothetical protein